MTIITPEEILQDYTAMGDSVDLITGIIAGNKLEDKTSEDKKSTVSRNVEHLELLVSQDYWTNEDMTAVNAAIVAGNSYIA
jgi:hypothetical protein